MKLKRIMTTDVATVAPDATASQAASTMQMHDVGALPVCEMDDKIVGIVTDRDIVVRGLTNQASPDDITIRNVMSNRVITGTPDMDVRKAAQLMSNEKIRRLPVVDHDKVVGMVSLGDFATAGRLEETAIDVMHDVCASENYNSYF